MIVVFILCVPEMEHEIKFQSRDATCHLRGQKKLSDRNGHRRERSLGSLGIPHQNIELS